MGELVQLVSLHLRPAGRSESTTEHTAEQVLIPLRFPQTLLDLSTSVSSSALPPHITSGVAYRPAFLLTDSGMRKFARRSAFLDRDLTNNR